MRGKERESEREIERVGVRKGFNVRSDHASEFELNFDKICLRRTFWKPKAKKRLRSTFKINQRKSWVAFSTLTAFFTPILCTYTSLQLDGMARIFSMKVENQ